MSQTAAFGTSVSVTIDGLPMGVSGSISVSIGQPVLDRPIIQESGEVPVYGPSIMEQYRTQHYRRMRFTLLSRLRAPSERDRSESHNWKKEGF